MANKFEINDEELKKVAGGKSYWDGPFVRFSSDDGDWHKGDRFYLRTNGQIDRYAVIQENGVFKDNMTGHVYNAKVYNLNTDVFMYDTTFSDYDVMMKKDGLEWF